MEVLLTGASGLLGANLAHLLAGKGLRPRVLLRERSDRRGLRGLKLSEHLGDLNDLPSLERAMQGVEQVYHLAGLVRFDPFSRELLERTHLEGTQNVLRAAAAAGVKRLVHVSSIAAVGHGPLTAPATEDTPYNFPEHPYHSSKRQGEEASLAASGKGLEVVVANPTFVLGAYDVRPTSGELLLRVSQGLIAFYPLGGNNFVAAEDVAEGLWRLMERGRAGQRYILGGENLTYRAFLTQCAEEAGVRPPILPAPGAVLRAAAAAGDRLGFLAPGLFRYVNSPFLSSLDLPAYASSEKARREVGYSPRPARWGIREAYRWFQEEGVLARDRPLTPRGVIDGAPRG